MLPVYVTNKNLDFEDVLKFKPYHIEHDWFGLSSPPLPRFILVRDLSHLWFYAAYGANPVYEARHKCGSFAEGLWKHDVAELFVCNDSSQAYQEFNLSPGGAWWTCRFEHYRKPAKLTAEEVPEINCFSIIDKDSWQAAMAIPLDLFRGFTSLSEHSRANVTFITDTPNQKFWSWAKIEAPRPDFHCAEQFEKFCPMRECPLRVTI